MTVNANLAHDAQTNQSGHRVDGVVPTLIDAKVKGDALTLSIVPAPDTHFSGANAIAAFNDAGGSSYTGAKVPVENAVGGSGIGQPGRSLARVRARRRTHDAQN